MLAPFFDVGVPWCSSVPMMFFHVLSILQRVNSPKPSEAFRSPDSGEQTSGDRHAGEPMPPASATVQQPLFFFDVLFKDCLGLFRYIFFIFFYILLYIFIYGETALIGFRWFGVSMCASICFIDVS